MVGTGPLRNSKAIVQDAILESAEFAAETEGLILHLVNRESPSLVLTGLRDVGSTPLDIMLSQTARISRARILITLGTSREVRANEA